jgi:ribosomal protein L7/L12
MDEALIALPALLSLVLIGVLWHATLLLRLAKQGDQQLKLLASLDRKFQRALEHLGAAEPAPTFPEVEQLLDAGRTLQAIKAYREATGVGLKDAKEAVDELARRRGR